MFDFTLNIFKNTNSKHTSEIIETAKISKLHEQIMFIFHPQWWRDKPLSWLKELMWLNMKNVVKHFMYVTK